MSNKIVQHICNFLVDNSRRKKKRNQKTFYLRMYLRHNSSLMERWSYIYYKSSFAIRSQDLQDPKTFI